MAGSMRGVDDACEWRNALKKLNDSKAEEVDEVDEVFKVLKYSYDRLSNLKLQKCFLYCALFPEDHRIARRELIDHLIDEEVIIGESRAVEFDEGHSILNRLERVCLLEVGDVYYDGRYVKMHDLVRDMAIKIMQIDQTTLVEAGKQLTEMPEEERWAENIVKCSLMYNNIEEIPPGYSPKCPNLSTLLLSNNLTLKSLHASFFEQLDGLKVLDLSWTGIKELPGSVAYLVNLSALLLRGCHSLSKLPSLENMKALKNLDIHCSPIFEVPEGIELLVKLRYLNFRETYIMNLPSQMLLKLSNLHFLSLNSQISIKAEDLSELKKLETLICRFDNVGELNAYTSIFPVKLTQFCLLVGVLNDVYEAEHEDITRQLECNQVRKCVYISSCEIDGVINLPAQAEELLIWGCYIKTSESYLQRCLQNVTNLVQLRIECCEWIECLFSSSTDTFQSLQKIEVMLPLSTYPRLRKIDISYCSYIKYLFPQSLISNFQSLETIRVCGCKRMEVLIAKGEEDEKEDHNIEFIFPKLKSLALSQVPELICSRRLVCNSIEDIFVEDCPKLKEIPVSLILTDDGGQPIPLPSLRKIDLESRERWDKLEFEHPEAKDLLFPLCEFRYEMFSGLLL